MNYEQARATKKAEKEGNKAEAALQVMPTVEAGARRVSLSAKFASVRNTAARSEQADAVLRAARGNKKDHHEALVDITSSAVRMIAASGKASLLPPFVTDGSTSPPDVARYLVKSLKNLPEAAMVHSGVSRMVEACKAADEAAKKAESDQVAWERKLYVALSEFNHELENVHAYIKLNTELESTARRKLKRRAGSRRRQPKAERAPAEPDTSKPSDGDAS